MTFLRHSLPILSVTALVFGLVGCATQKSSSVNEAPKTTEKKKGRWVVVESELGSNLPRRVWVADDGTVTAETASGPARVDSTTGDSVRAKQIQGQHISKPGGT